MLTSRRKVTVVVVVESTRKGGGFMGPLVIEMIVGVELLVGNYQQSTSRIMAVRVVIIVILWAVALARDVAAC